MNQRHKANLSHSRSFQSEPSSLFARSFSRAIALAGVIALSTGSRAQAVAIDETVEDGAFTDSFVDRADNSATPSIGETTGVLGSRGLVLTNDQFLVAASGIEALPARTAFSVFYKHTSVGSGQFGQIVVGFTDTTTQDTGPFFHGGGFGGDNGQPSVGAGVTLEGTGNVRLSTGPGNFLLDGGTRFGGPTATLTVENWYSLNGTIDFNGVDTFTFTLNLDDYGSDGGTFVSNLLTGSASQTYAAIGTDAAFYINTNHDRGVRNLDNISVAVVPEPSVAGLAAIGVIGLLRRRR